MRIQKQILDKFPQVAYAECEVSQGRFEGAMSELNVDKDELRYFPTIVLVSDGVGKWVHGPNASPFAVEIIEAMASNSQLPGGNDQVDLEQQSPNDQQPANPQQ